MDKLITRASSINRALDQIGDKWCLLIFQEVFWGVNTFTGLMEAMGVSRGVLSDRLKFMQSIDCLQQVPGKAGSKRMRYRLTVKSLDFYHCALMALQWERRFFNTPELEQLTLVHRRCGHAFTPHMHCRACSGEIDPWQVSYRPGPGACSDERDKKVRRRSSIPMDHVPGSRHLYRNLVNIVGDRWTANVIALSFHGLSRFEQFHRELPVATNILSDRLRSLVQLGIFEQRPYQQRPLRHEYRLTDKGEATYPFFLALLQWGDRWCDSSGRGRPLRLRHDSCGRALHAQVVCSECGGVLEAQDVDFEFGEVRDTA